MSYKSQAFEQQLKKHKAEQALKGIADLPDHRHRPAERVTPSRPGGKLDGKPQIRSRQVEDIDIARTERKRPLRPDQMLDADGNTIVIVQRRTPVYRRSWFLMLAVTVVSTALSPVLFKDQFARIKTLSADIKANTGVDPLDVNTYKDMAKGKLATPGVTAVTAKTTVQPITPVPEKIGSTAEVVQQAQDRAMDVVKSGSDQSFKYIEEETQRLNAMAQELDKRQGR